MNTSIQNNNYDNINPESNIIKIENSLDNLKLYSEKEEIKKKKEKKKKKKKKYKIKKKKKN